MSVRRPRQRAQRGRSMLGERYDVEVGPVAHGGHCVARVPTGDGETRVVFVRHGIPGELVTVEITEGSEGDRFWRGDVVAVREASADRVPAPCPIAGPGLCGGCDFQHVRLDRQRALKAEVVAEQLRRIAGLHLSVTVEPVPNPLAGPGEEGLRWRTRHRYARTADGRRGMRRHRSHDVIPIEDCLLDASGREPSAEGAEVASGRAREPHRWVDGHEFRVPDGGFWQVHPGAPRTLVAAVLDFLSPRPGESVLDLYAGVGLFSRFLHDAVGPTGHVLAVEGEPRAAAAIEHNCPEATRVSGDVARSLATAYGDPVDLVVLDPPRAGAKRRVVEQIVARRPRAVAHVACDPAALARDVALFAEHGYAVRGLRAFDLFPMTHHVECVALLQPTAVGGDR